MPQEPDFVLTATPIPELTIDGGMDAEMVWEQMELRGQTVDRMLDEMFGQEEGPEDDDDLEGMFDEEEADEDDSGEEELEGFGRNSQEDDDESEAEDDDAAGEDESEVAQAEYFRRLGEGKEEGLDSEDPAFASDDQSDAEGELQGDVEHDALTDEQRGLSLDNFDGEGKGKRSRPSKR